MRKGRQKKQIAFLTAGLAALLLAAAVPDMGGKIRSKENVQALAQTKNTAFTIDAVVDTDSFSYHDIMYISWRVWSAQMDERKRQEEERQRELDAWRLVLVNSEHPLGEEYEVKRTKVGNNQYVDERIADELNAMLEAARADGIEIWVISGYRSYARQVRLYENKIKRLKRQGYTEEEAITEAGTEVAVPGTSEHMTGLAVDLVSADNTLLEEEQEQTESYQWLLKHCMEYGFIVRYPENKKEITGIIYEPWHFRYVGKEHAGIIMGKGLCLEEYLEEFGGEYEKKTNRKSSFAG